MYTLFGKNTDQKEFEIISKKLFQFNYIKNYPITFGKTKINNDVGWGCAIRSFQMMLSYILQKNNINKNKILSLLYKYDGKLSLPIFIKELNKRGYKEGTYLGGFLISNIYINLLLKVSIDLFVTENNIIDIDKLYFNKFTILTFSVRLGINNIGNYKNIILNCFNCKYFGGFIGGVGSSSYYFYAKDINNNLYYIDPHNIMDYDNNIKDINKFLVKKYFSINIKKINPSITFCFYYSNYYEFIELKKFLEKYTLFNILNIKDNKKYSCSNSSKEWEIIV